MKLPSFPVPVPGETVHSVVARCLARHSVGKNSIIRLLGLESTIPHGFASGGVIALANLVPAGHPWYENPRQIIDANTLLPVYLSFYRLDKREELLQHIIAGTGNYARALLGTLPQSGIRTENYKFCGECVKESLEFGFPVSRLEHQPSFVRVCAKHSTPLVHGCMNCYRTRFSLTRWQMAGECTCTGAVFQWEQFEGGTSDYESALWLSRQVRQLLLNPPPDDVYLASRVAEMVKANFMGRLGLEGIAIWNTLEKKFGREFLRQLGIQFPEFLSKYDWPQRLTSQRSIEKGRGPLLKFLLLSSLVVDEVNALYEGWNFKGPSISTKAPIAKGYSTIRSDRSHDEGEKERLLVALNSHSSLLAAARSLGMYFNKFTGGLVAAGISVPISEKILAKYGKPKLQQIREDLILGIPKKSIARNNKVTMNVVERVQLANPELAVAHRSATINMTRDAHRKTMLDYKKSNPKAGRNEIALATRGADDWLRIYDKTWLQDFWPAKKKFNAPGQVRKTNCNWAALDAKLVDELFCLIAAEKGSANRPRRITLSRMCSELKVHHHNLVKLPRLKITLEENSETREQVLTRIIKWAILRYAELKIPLNGHKFNMIANLTHKVVKNNRAKIVFEAQRVGIPINMKSLFALVREDEMVNLA